MRSFGVLKSIFRPDITQFTFRAHKTFRTLMTTKNIFWSPFTLLKLTINAELKFQSSLHCLQPYYSSGAWRIETKQSLVRDDRFGNCVASSMENLTACPRTEWPDSTSLIRKMKTSQSSSQREQNNPWAIKTLFWSPQTRRHPNQVRPRKKSHWPHRYRSTGKELQATSTNLRSKPLRKNDTLK